MGPFGLPTRAKWGTYLSSAGLTAKVRTAESTPYTRLPSTRLAKLQSPPRENVVTTENSLDMEDRPNLSSTRRLRPLKRSLSMECTTCKYRKQLAIKRCKHFELGGDKKKKGQMIQF